MALYEKTRLREFFYEEMGKVEPRWMECPEKSQVQSNALVAIEFCENDMLVKRARG
jgi:hypothetical protein